MKKTGLGIVAAPLCVALLLVALPASAAEVTREEYKADVEPICKTNTEANEKILKRERSKANQGKRKPAGRQFLRAATALKGTLRQLKAVPQPTSDETRLGAWVTRGGEQQRL